ncbi:hypothetical protein [Flagellimonas allohymeniacidonis]|uniref:Uncharacterized protein n=1 Tax=Flagellimonas allohymeniacidonis TaxID=2517819 RepID=A0A4Q8QG85_9FLAO|nr:hypothetical protein [Allomuricauda hymeniacidonis]TAI47369.1 hypothetical protein EW142_11885 [Allomuricauda hymeniacidonis]
MEQHKKYERGIERFVTTGFKVFFMILIVIVFTLLAGYVTMLLWNWLMPDIFGLTSIGYWQALGILVLAKLLFGLGNHSSKSSKSKAKRKEKMERFCKPKTPFSEWKHYDQFWKEEGEEAYRAYLNRIENQKEDGNT